MVVTMNVDHVCTLARDDEFRSAYGDASIVTADGFPVYAYARLKGCDVPQRVAGADLFSEIMRRIDPDAGRVVFVCSDARSGERLRTFCLAKGFPSESVLCIVPPFGFERDGNVSRTIAHRISAFAATHIFFGIGAPKSEKWAHRFLRQNTAVWCCCFGAGLEYFARTRTRAPSLLRRFGMEWAWRLAAEPRRLSRRYLLGASIFLRLVVRDWRQF